MSRTGRDIGVSSSVRHARAMPVLLACVSALLCVVLAGWSSCEASEKVTVPGTTLKIELPAGWRIGPPLPGFRPADVLWHDGSARYLVQVNAAATGVVKNPQMAATSSCGFLLGVMLSTEAGKTANRITRPAFFPASYFGSVVEIPNKLLIGCLNDGSRIVGVTIVLHEGPPTPELLLPLLKVISAAAFSEQKFVERPANLHLKLLDMDVPVPQGEWSAQENTDHWGHNDMIVRVLAQWELTVTPFVFPFPGSCSALILGHPETVATVVKGAAYVGPTWSATAYAQVQPPGTFVLAYVCRDIGSGRMLMAQIMEEGTAIQESDYAVISSLLESIAKAVDERVRTAGLASLRVSEPAPAPSATRPGERVSVMLRPAPLIKQDPPIYPPLARQARIQGTVVLKALIATDGNVESLEVSGHPMLVNAAMEAVKQRSYKPYFVNGLPVEVLTTVSVNFSLAESPQKGSSQP